MFKSWFKGKKREPVPRAARDAFDVAFARYEQSRKAVGPYCRRARNRAMILRARHQYEESKDIGAYEKVVAAYSDTADFAPYTESELDEFTFQMECVSAEFEAFGAAFIALHSPSLDPEDEYYITSHAYFNMGCECQKTDIEIYQIAALSAAATATRSISEAAKNNAKGWLWEEIASGADETKRIDAEAKSAEFKANALSHAKGAEPLLKKARLAESNAEAFLAKVIAAEDKVEEALKMKEQRS